MMLETHITLCVTEPDFLKTRFCSKKSFFWKIWSLIIPEFGLWYGTLFTVGKKDNAIQLNILQ